MPTLNKKMIVRKPETDSLDPKATGKFAEKGQAGRVMNVEAETDGGGTAEVLLKHPDGSVEKLAGVTVPELSKAEKCILRIRIDAAMRDSAPGEPA